MLENLNKKMEQGCHKCRVYEQEMKTKNARIKQLEDMVEMLQSKVPKPVKREREKSFGRRTEKITYKPMEESYRSKNNIDFAST